MQLINHKLPRLSKISRPAAWQIITFAVFNILLGTALLTAQARALDFFIVNNVMTPQLWGLLFLTIGVIKLTAYFTNHWSVMRYINVPALFFKLFWLIALIARQIEEPNTNIFLILMFGALASLQISLYLYFPTDKEAKGSKTPVGSVTIAKEIIKP